MSANEIANRLLQEYNRATKSPPVNLDSRGTAVIDVDGNVHITLYLGQHADSLIFLAEIVRLTSEPKDDAMIRALLSHSFPGYRVRGGALLINDADNLLVYSYEKKLNDLNPARLENIIGNFSATVLYFREQAMQARLV